MSASGAGSQDSNHPVIVLDFDGTVCLGDDPVRFYGEGVAARLQAADGERLLSRLEEFLSGDLQLPGCEDGYHAVVALAEEASRASESSEIDDDERRLAYRESRARLDAGEGQTEPPAGLAEFLTEMRGAGATVVLVTNAPLLGVGSWLSTHGLAEHLDAVIPDAGKPARMLGVLTGIMARYGVPEQSLVSVGDVWRNDIEPAMELGAAGLFINRFGADPGPSTASAPSMVELYPAIRSWVAEVQGQVETQSSPN